MDGQVRAAQHQADVAWGITEEKAMIINDAWHALGGETGRYRGLTLVEAIKAAIRDAREEGRRDATRARQAMHG